MKSNNPKYRNPLDGYSSELKSILIPLDNFNHYHDADNTNGLDDSYIGRERIIGKLKNWITDENSLVGTYLVTGYRGMGKSSFVNRVLKEIQSSRKFISKGWFIFLKIALIAFTLFLCVKNSKERHVETVEWFFCGLLIGTLFLFFIWSLKILLRKRENRKVDKSNVNNGKLRTEYLEVRINIGKEIVTKADDIMRLIVKNVHDSFKEYVRNSPHKHLFNSYMKLCLSLTITFLIISYTQVTSLTENYENFSAFFADSYNVVVSLYKTYPKAATLVLSLLTMGISFYLTDFVFRLMGKIKLFGFPTYESILSDLSKLYHRTIASVDESSGALSQQISFFSRLRKYEKATLREMEQELIQIFNDISEKRYISKCSLASVIRFVIVLDELDKVDVAESGSTGNDDLPYYDVSASGFAGSQNARKRKQQLMKTLANMKYFLSTVKAKFIFVGGRELFDAYLGDVSDREYSISSVFDGVLNINSFFTSGSKGSDVTDMTEQFVCTKLCPPERKVKTLKDYYNYLTELENKPGYNIDELSKNRLISFLYKYILYLVHISNGSPKKISVFFEKNVRTKEYLANISDANLPEYGDKNVKYYLSFNVKDIYKVGFMHYISYPVIQTMSGKANVFEDKLLVSTSFIINHIYKYHNTGFSWRNLEHIPELLDMNKTPELRDFLGSIVALLNQTHLASIQSGLYLFKFPMRISEEISFISKQIEDISALFHFSKDESQPVKRHYIHQLDYYTHSRNNIKDVDLYTLASLHHILADIYQADEDYSQAIYEYQTGLQLVSRQLTGEGYDNNPHWISKMLFIMRNMLKMGVAFEKRKTYDSAYTTYNELIKQLFDYREFKEGDLGLDYYLYKKKENEDKLGWDALLYSTPNSLYRAGEHSERFLLDTKLSQRKYAFASDQLTHEFTRILTPKKLAVLMRQSLFTDIRMAYLPTLAKLFVLEKLDTEGITSSNLELAEAEFFYLHLFVNDELRPLIYSDFFQKMGDILYYKNGLPDQPVNNILHAVSLNGYDVRSIKENLISILPSSLKKEEQTTRHQSKHYCLENSKIDKVFEIDSMSNDLSIDSISDSVTRKIRNIYQVSEITDAEVKSILESKKYLFEDPRVVTCMRQRCKMEKDGKRVPCHACKYYNMSFASILQNLLDIKIIPNKSKCVSLIENLVTNKDKYAGKPQNSLLMTANTLKGLANAKLSCSDKACQLDNNFLTFFFNAFEVYYKVTRTGESELDGCNCDDINSLEKALLLYMEAGMFFDMAGRTNDASQMYRQILEIFNLYLRVHASENDYNIKYVRVIASHLNRIGFLVNTTIRILYGNYEGINLLEVSVLKNLFRKSTKSDIPLNHLPLTPDVEELIYRYYALYLRCDMVDVFKDIYNAGIMGRNRQLCTFSQDVQNMRFKFMMNSKIVEHLTGIKRPETMSDDGLDTSTIFSSLYNYLSTGTSKISKVLKTWGLKDSQGDDIACESDAEKLDILNFFVIDTLSCLSKMKNILLQLNNPTTYISYFMGDVCLYIAFWRNLYNELDILYADAYDYSKTATIGQVDESYKSKYQGNPDYRKLYQRLADTRFNEQFELYTKQRINDQDLERLFLTYNAEQAIQYYENAREMHVEGRNYKENILTLYFLDDDLNNDSIQQNLALERYLINSDNLQDRTEMLKDFLDKSRLFNNESYLN